MELDGKKVLVVGLGKSGLAAARLCLQKGARVTATDLAPSPAGAEELAALGVRLSLGGHRLEDFLAADVVVLSPGVDHRRPEVRAAAGAGAEVIGELELGYRFLEARTVMITGTNGKSTVTTLVGEMLKAAGRQVFAGGNLGNPLCGFLARGGRAEWVVLEVSSFQTDTSVSLAPQVAVILSLTPDHLDRYNSFADYARSKFRLFARQAPGAAAILNADDPEIMARRDLVRGGTLLAYGLAGPRRPGAWQEGDQLVFALPGRRRSGSRPPLAAGGVVNRQNLLAAGLAGLAAGVAPATVQAVIDAFPGLPHRIQFVAEIDGGLYDDSKGTNLGAVLAAVESLARPLVLFLGGRDKAGDFTVLAPLLKKWGRLVVCFGEAGPKIAGQLAGAAPLVTVPDLPAGLAKAREAALPGDLVLLSPGCASFDAYTGYAARGDHFQGLVREMARG